MSDLIPKHGSYRKLKSFQVARASLEEVKLDYEDFLRQRGLAQWDMGNSLRQALMDQRCQSADGVAAWVKDVSRFYGQGGQGDRMSTRSTESTLSTHIYPEISANAVLVLITVACSLLDRQVERPAKDFQNKGGFTERLYCVRSAKRRSFK